MVEDKERYINEKETAQITGFALPTLRNHRSRGIGIPYVKAGRSIRYSLKDVIKYMESRKVKTKAA
jgi:predicted DNA-binding transcriptional regulator AlpA